MLSLRLDHLRNKVLLLALSIIAFSGRAWSADSIKDTIGLNGSVRGGYWLRDKSYSDERHYPVGSLWATLKPKEWNGFKLVADGYVQREGAKKDSAAMEDLREFYVETSKGEFDFRVGRQIMVWGRADKVNPTDNLTVRHYKLLVTDDEDQRSGVGAAQITYNVNQFRLIGIWLPEWREPGLPLQKTAGIEIHHDRPSHPEKQFAAKLDRSGGDVDWSFSYASVVNQSPDLVLNQAGSSGLDLSLAYNPIRVFGADFATTMGSYGLRGEAAYTLTEDRDGKDPLKQNSSLFVVLGADRSIFDGFSLNAQGLYKQIQNYRDAQDEQSVLDQSLGAVVQLNSNQLSKDMFGMTVRPSLKLWNDALEIEVAQVQWFGMRGSSLTRPKVTYAVNDAVRVCAGGEWYERKRDTFFGRLKDTSSAFSEVRWIF